MSFNRMLWHFVELWAVVVMVCWAQWMALVCIQCAHTQFSAVLMPCSNSCSSLIYSCSVACVQVLLQHYSQLTVFDVQQCAYSCCCIIVIPAVHRLCRLVYDNSDSDAGCSDFELIWSGRICTCCTSISIWFRWQCHWNTIVACGVFRTQWGNAFGVWHLDTILVYVCLCDIWVQLIFQSVNSIECRCAEHSALRWLLYWSLWWCAWQLY